MRILDSDNVEYGDGDITTVSGSTPGAYYPSSLLSLSSPPARQLSLTYLQLDRRPPLRQHRLNRSFP
jgi:hypothetical protein